MFSTLPTLGGRDIASAVLAFAAVIPLLFALYGLALLARSRGNERRRLDALHVLLGSIAAAVVAALAYAVVTVLWR